MQKQKTNPKQTNKLWAIRRTLSRQTYRNCILLLQIICNSNKNDLQWKEIVCAHTKPSILLNEIFIVPLFFSILK